MVYTNLTTLVLLVDKGGKNIGMDHLGTVMTGIGPEYVMKTKDKRLSGQMCNILPLQTKPKRQDRERRSIDMVDS